MQVCFNIPLMLETSFLDKFLILLFHKALLPGVGWNSQLRVDLKILNKIPLGEVQCIFIIPPTEGKLSQVSQ